MWRLKKVRHKFGRQINCSEEFRLKRREHEKALRRARKDKQLVSKRLLIDDEEHQAFTVETTSGEPHDVVELIHNLKRCGSEKEFHLRRLAKALHDSSAQLAFVKQENGMKLLVGLLTGSNAECRLLAGRCLHELSHSPHADVSSACLPATTYLLTFLSGQSTKFTELCLYTLGNMCPDSKLVREKLLAQGIIPALANCLARQRRNFAVVEAVGFALSQLLQTEDPAGNIIPVVLASSLPSHLLSALTPDPEFGLAPAIECAWCLHYLICSAADHSLLLREGALSRCSSLLLSLGDAVAEGNKEEGMDLLVFPLLSCFGNLLASCPSEDLCSQVGDVRLVAGLCTIVEAYLHTRPAIARVTTWVLNNLTAHSPDFCAAILNFHLVPGLIQILPFSQGINTMSLRILANVAQKEKTFCVQLWQLGLLSAILGTLKMADQEMVTLSLDVLLMLFVSCPQVPDEFAKRGGVSLLEAIQYNSEGEMRRRATHLLQRHLGASNFA